MQALMLGVIAAIFLTLLLWWLFTDNDDCGIGYFPESYPDLPIERKSE